MMILKLAFVGLLLGAVCLQGSFQISLPSDPTYHAGVVELEPSKALKANNKVKENLARFKGIIESEATRDLDILVFPEYVLNNMEWKTFVPDPVDLIAPCDIPNYHYFLTTLSCAARSRGLYVVINIIEKELCASHIKGQCDPSGLNTYNTNVVFDRHGRVISRYRKTHLYRNEWYSTNVMAKPQLAMFDTDFGVRFGHFICFDMLFYEPAQTLIREFNITNIIYPTYWFSELPFLTAVQLQEGWAYASDVNLLAADASNPTGQNTGSGIYAGKLGRLAATINESPKTELLTARVPKRSQHDVYLMPPTLETVFVPQLETARFTGLDLLRDYNVDIFTTKLLTADFISVTETLCHGAFCCDFHVNRTLISQSAQHSAYRFRLAVYSGAQTTHQQIERSELSVCAIIACTTVDLYSCGHIFPKGVNVGNKYFFSKLSVAGFFRSAPRRLIMPSTVDAQMMPLPVAMYDMTEVQSLNTTHTTMTLTRPKSDLLTFGIWANYYTNNEVTHNLNPPTAIKVVNMAATLNESSAFLRTLIVLSLFVTLVVSLSNK